MNYYSAYLVFIVWAFTYKLSYANEHVLEIEQNQKNEMINYRKSKAGAVRTARSIYPNGRLSGQNPGLGRPSRKINGLGGSSRRV
jgi:hypothetical protein